MAVTRRQAIVGLGALAAGAGAFAGTGAFDSQAARGLSVEFSDDSSARLAIGPAGDRDSVTVAEGEDGVVTIRIDQVNANARTVIDDLVEFTNNGERRVVSMRATLDDASENAELGLHGDLSGIDTIDRGESVVGLGFVIDTRGYGGEPEIGGTVSITAVTELRNEEE